MTAQISKNRSQKAKSTKILIGNLPLEADEAFIYDLLSKLGEVRNIEIPTNPKTGRLLGFAHVEMSRPEQASLAVEKLDGKEIQSRKLSVEIQNNEKKSGWFSFFNFGQ